MPIRSRSISIISAMNITIQEDLNSDVSSVSQQKKDRRSAVVKPTAEVVPMMSSKRLNSELDRYLVNEKKKLKTIATHLSPVMKTEYNIAIEELKTAPKKVDLKKVEMLTLDYASAADATKDTLNNTYEDFSAISNATRNLDHNLETFDKILNEIEDI